MSFIKGFEKTALFGLLGPEFVSGFDKERPGVIAKVRHNFRKKDVHETVEGDWDEKKGRFKNLRPSGQFFTISGSGIENFSDKVNKKLLSNKEFQAAREAKHKFKKTAFDWKALFKSQKGVDIKTFRKSLGLGPTPAPERFNETAKIVSKIEKRRIARNAADAKKGNYRRGSFI